MTTIQWTDETWNPVRGCSIVSEGCKNCYAMAQGHRFSGEGMPYHGLTRNTPTGPKWTGRIRLLPHLLEKPLRWKKPRRVFVNSMSDLFHEDVPDEFIDQVFAAMALCPQHTFQILTKRPERMRRCVSDMTYDRGNRAAQALLNRQSLALFPTQRDGMVRGPDWPLPNVWLGVSCENQETADARIPLLMQTPAAVRWISAEPLLGPIDLGLIGTLPRSITGSSYQLVADRLRWVVVGGESGPKARPCNVEWIRSIVTQCRTADVPAFVKQMGRWVAGEHAGFMVDRWLLEDGYIFVPPMLGFQAKARPENAVAFHLFDGKGDEPIEWPEDLRVREYPCPA